MKLLSLFSGIGAFEKGFERAGLEFDLVNYCEIDKYASMSYSAVHGVPESKNLWDVTKIDTSLLPYIHALTHGSPCQDFSVAGKGEGGEEGSGTRSSLLWHSVRIIREKRPRYVLWENVKNVLSKNHRHVFDAYLETLEGLGYTNYYKVLNAKNYGIPQNRERVFCLSILKEFDSFGGHFPWPEPFDNGIRLKHLLEPTVDEGYYIGEEKCAKLISQLKEVKIGGCTLDKKTGAGDKFLAADNQTLRNIGADTASTITARYYKGLGADGDNAVIMPCLTPDRLEKRQNGRRFKDDDEPMFTLTGQDRHGVAVRVANKQGYQVATEGDSINLEQPSSNTRRGRVGVGVAQTLNTGTLQVVVEPKIIKVGDLKDTGYEQGNRVYSARDYKDAIKILEPNETVCIGHCEGIKGHDYNRRVYSPDGASPSLAAHSGGNLEPKTVHGFRIRKLTPLECWRLMGFSDEDYHKAAAVCSKTQLYKQAGNSIVVDIITLLAERIKDNEFWF